MSGFLITLTSKHGQTASVVSAGDVTERLRHIGLEWKQADQFHDHEVVITIQPYRNEYDRAEVKAKIREASALLEETGLL